MDTAFHPVFHPAFHSAPHVGTPGDRRRAIGLQLLGYPTVLVAGRAAPLRLKRALALVALVAESAGRLGRGHAAALLWPDADERTARSRLRRLLHETHQQLGAELLRGDADTLAFAVPVACDLHALRGAAAALDARRPAPPTAPALDALLAPLLEPQAHQLLSGFTIDSPAFGDWLEARRREHAALLARALQRAAEAALAAGDAALAERAGQRLLALDPCAEDGAIARMAALALRGDAAGVETAYFDCAETLRRELGVRPSARLEQAYADATRHLCQVRPRASAIAPGAAAAPGPVAAGGHGAVHQGPEVRFADAGAGQVAYACIGSARLPTLVVNWGLMSNLDVSLEEPSARRVLDTLARRFHVVMFDRRGCGLSERVGVEPTVAEGARDIEAVLDDLGVHDAWLFGSGAGGAVAIEFAATRPARTAGLLLFGTAVRGAWSPDHPWAMQPAELAAWVERLASPERCDESLQRCAPSAAHAPAVQQWYARLLRQATSRNGAEAMLRHHLAMDVRARLERVRAPTLVLQRRGDRIVPPPVAQLIARRIAGAELVLLDGDDHFLWHGDAQALLAAIERFAARHLAGTAAGWRTAAGRTPSTMPAGCATGDALAA